MNKSAEEVMREVSAYFKSHNITHEEAARRLRYGSKRTLSNVLSKKRYLSRKQAYRFAREFPFSQEFLTTGAGELKTRELRVRDVNTPLLPNKPDAFRKVMSWMKTLTDILDDNDISEWYWHIYNYVFLEDVYYTEMLNNLLNREEWKLDKKRELREKIGDKLNVIFKKYPNGIAPKEEQL